MPLHAVNSTPTAARPQSRGQKSTRPGTAQSNSIPFAALPHALRKDPRLRGKDKAILLAAALLEYACNRASCYPTNQTLAEDLGCSPSTIRANLALLRDAGWITVVVGSNQPNGRRIILTWRCEPQPPRGQVSDTRQSTGTPPQPTDPPRRPVGTKVRRREEEERDVTDFLPPPDPQSAVPLAPSPTRRLRLPHRRGWSPPRPRPRCLPQDPRRP